MTSAPTASTAPGFLRLAAELTHQVAVSEIEFVPVAKRIFRQRTGASESATEQLRTTSKRYIVAAPAAQKSAGPTARASLKAIHDQFTSSILRSEHEDGRKVMSMTPLEANILRERYGGLMVEEDVQYRMRAPPCYRS
jgi:hypothetical protein